MFNIFKSSKSVIEAIHNEFNNAGETLLKEAKEIISGVSVHNEQKAKRLSNFGFNQTKEVLLTEAAQKEKRDNESLAKWIEYFMVKFPKYKFITVEIADKICKKYNLVIGDVKQYKGFVPEKNLQDIEDFFKVENEISVAYFGDSDWRGRRQEVTEGEYLRERESADHYSTLDPMIRMQMQRHRTYYSKNKRELKIAAPIKDMDTRGYELKGSIFHKEIPDPVVLVPITKDNHSFYCIVTAWGDEASDEMVVNETQN